jgi:ketosteroid isomerase-like protein
MRTKTYLPIAIAIAIVTACGNPQNKNESQKSAFDIAAVKAHILKMNESYSERFTSNDAAFFAQRYCKDAQLYCPNLPAVIGREAIQKFFYNDGNNQEAKIELPEGNFYGTENLVVEEGSYNFPDGKGGSVDKGKFIAIWKQEDGQWKMFREIWNTDNPPPQGN